MTTRTNVTVEHDAPKHRFVANVAGGQAELVYSQPDPKTIDLQHTSVPAEARGQHVAEALASTAFAYARQAGLRVIPTCPFVRQWLLRHPEQRDVILSGRG